MSATSSCPVCAKLVSIPDGVDPQATVRCPMCRAEFVLQTALPPMLEVVQEETLAETNFEGLAPAAMAAVAVGNEIRESELVDELEMTESADLSEVNSLAESPETVDSPDAMFAETMSDDLAFEMPAESQDEFEGGEEFDTELEQMSAAGSLDNLTDSDDDGLGELDLDQTPSDESPFGLGGPMSTEAEEALNESASNESEPEEAAIGGAMAAMRRRKKEPSMISNLIGVVGGGLLAIPLAYFIVLWIGGPEKDVLGWGSKLPSWMVPAAFHAPQTAANPPLPSNPTPGNLDEVKKAADDGGFGPMKLNVPDLPDKPADDAAANTEEPAEVTGNTDEEIAKDLAPSTDTTPSDTESPDAAEPKTASTDDAATDGEEMPDDAFSEATGTAATELPAADDEPAAEVGLKEPASYTADQLETVTGEVEKLSADMADVKHLDKDAAKKLRAQFFRTWYRLAETATFAKDAAKDQVSAMLTAVSEDEAKITEVGRAASKWLALDPAKRGEHQGVLLAGTVEDVAKSAGLHKATVLLAGENQPVTVYSDAAPEFAQGDSVVLVGSIVTNPQEAVHGFKGDEPLIIWQGLAVTAPAK